MNPDGREKFAMSRAAALWEDRWMRFRMALKQQGVERRHQDFYRGWVLSWIKFIKPRSFDEGNLEDVRAFLSHLGASAKKGWQVHQAEEALRILFQNVEPREWARYWPDDMVRRVPTDLGSEEAADLGRGLLGGAERFVGRSDAGECPPRYEGFLDGVRESLRVERYSYRTEKTYLEWTRRFVVFTRPEARDGIQWDLAKEYLEYLTLVRRVSASTLNQALSALQFVFRVVLKRPSGGAVKRPVTRKRVPTVLTQEKNKGSGDMKADASLICGR